jgi:tetratricopeptide (TPR) repeat protein
MQTPPEATLHYNKACKYLTAKNLERALIFFKKALALYSFKEAYLNMGNCYRLLNNDKKAIECYQLANKPQVPFHDGTDKPYTLAYNNLGLMHYMQGQDATALEIYERAIAIDPNYYDCLWNKSTALLRQACSGHPEMFANAWGHYEYRFLKTPPVTLKNSKPDLRPWDEKSTDNLIVMAEQGIGDNFMWARYIPHLQREIDNLWVQCNPDMVPLFEHLGVKTVFHTNECDATQAISMASLSRIYEGIPNGQWLRDYGQTHQFSNDGYNIGIVFAGSTAHVNNRNRSVPVHRFHALAKYAKLYCLSPGFKTTKFVQGLDIKDWQDTIAYIRGLDLVITVDTSIVHLCGCLGVECWMLQPLKETDFRWGDETMGSKNIWYPSVEVYRNPNDWNIVFDQVEQDLKDRVYG